MGVIGTIILAIVIATIGSLPVLFSETPQFAGATFMLLLFFVEWFGLWVDRGK